MLIIPTKCYGIASHQYNEIYQVLAFGPWPTVKFQFPSSNRFGHPWHKHHFHFHMWKSLRCLLVKFIVHLFTHLNKEEFLFYVFLYIVIMISNYKLHYCLCLLLF